LLPFIQPLIAFEDRLAQAVDADVPDLSHLKQGEGVRIAEVADENWVTPARRHLALGLHSA
jgi:hypothetical protein